MEVDKRTEKKVRKAMSKLIVDNKFFAVLLLQQTLKYTLDVPTFGTDGKTLYVNPVFAATLTPEQIRGVLVHELMHCMFTHMTRRGERDPRLYNAAADYAINPLLKKDKFVLPPDHLDDPKYHGKTADEIYNLLKREGKKPEDMPEELMDIIENKNLSEAERTKLEQDTKINIAKAMAAAGDDVPSSIKDLVEQALETKVDWKAKLREFIQVSLGDDEQTWKKPNRNYLHDDLYIPSLQGHSMPSIACMIDTSGSIYGNMELFEEFTAEIKKIVEDLSPEQVDIFYVDTSVKRHDTFEQDEEPTFEVEGGGGTDFRSAWPKMEEAEPNCIIAFTDAWASFPDSSSVDTLWMVYENKNADVPFGEVTYVS